MISAKEIDRQLKNIGVSFWFFGNAEIRELRHILVEGEVIEHCLLGRYEGGFAVLCATNMRLLLIDKKPFYLTMEDVRYDMIVEVDFAGRLIDATIRVCTPNKTLHFTALKKAELRLMTVYIQNRVMVYRQQHIGPGQSFEAPQPQQTTWQPQRLIEQEVVSPHRSIKTIAKTAIGESSRVGHGHPIANMRQAINPYARSSFTIRQRISRL